MYLYIRLGPQGIRAVPAPPVSVQASLSSLDSSHGLAEQNIGLVKSPKAWKKASYKVFSSLWCLVDVQQDEVF